MYRQTYMDTTSRSLLKMESASLQWDPLPVLLANVQVEKPSVETQMSSLLSPSGQCSVTAKGSRKEVLKSRTTPSFTNHCCPTCFKAAQKNSP